MPSKSTRRKVRHGGVGSGSRPRRPFGARASSRSLLTKPAGYAVENMEARVYLSVTTNQNGYTVVTPSFDSKIIYVSSGGGNDSNAGTSPATAVATVGQARSLLAGRNNMPDEILLRRGDLFTGAILNWTISGRSVTQPFVIGAYTDPAHPSTVRPLILAGTNSGFANGQTTSSHAPISFVDILGVAFQANYRNYRQPPANFTTGFHDDVVGGTYGLNLLGQTSNIFVEDCSFQYFRTGVSVQSYSPFGTNPSNFELRRCDVIDNYAQSYSAVGYITSEGIFAEGVQGITLDGNVFDHNGWTDPAYGNLGSFPTIYNHDAYITFDNTNLIATGNIFSNASSHGLQARCGGTITNNLFINDPIAMSFGYVNGHETAGGVSGVISGNVIYGSRDINGQPRGWGLEIGNLRPKSTGGGTVVQNNVYASYNANGQPALQLSFGGNTVNPLLGVGINDLTIQDNIVYGWTEGIYINPGFSPGSTSRYGFNNVSFLNNEFQQVYATPVIQHYARYSAAQETWRGNRYNIQGGNAASTSSLFQLSGTAMSLAQWQKQVEPTANAALITYPNPNNSPATYDATQGGPGTLTDFIAQARTLSSTFYRPQFTAIPVENYIVAGFSGQRIDNQPPTGTLSAGTIAAAGGATAIFTVTWNDDNQVNFASVGNGDVQLTGPNGYTQTAKLLTASANAAGSSVTAVYSVPAANGTWSFMANGTYTVAVVAGQVTDTSGNPVAPGPLGTFLVKIAPPAPSASLVVADVTNPNAPAMLTVTYSATGGLIDATTLDSNDLLVTGPNGFQTTAQFVSESPTSNYSPLVGTYQIAPPSGGWSPSDNGLYQVSVQAGQIATDAPQPIGSALLGTFSVNVTVPTAAATGPTVVNASASADEIITATFTSSAGIPAADVSAANIQITGTSSYYADASTGLTLVPGSVTGAGTPASPLVAKYDVPKPTGGWTDSTDGTYTVTLLNNQIIDANGNSANGGPIGTFDVNVDTMGPSAISTTPNIYKPTSATTQPITIVYDDPSGVNTNLLGSGNITVNFPDGSQPPITFVSAVPSASGTSVTATYSVSTPNGFGVADNGAYQIFVNQAADNLGNFTTPGTLAGTFNVSIGTTPPTGSASASDVTNPAQVDQINVFYSDTPGVDLATIADGNILVVGTPNGSNTPVTLPVTLISVDAPDGANANAVYQLNPPAGGWQANYNGAYNIVLQPNQVADLSGNIMPTQTLGTLNVNISVVPTGMLLPVNPDPAAPGLNQLTVQFSQKMLNVDATSVKLSLNGGPNLLTSAQTFTSTDGGYTFVLNNLSSVTTQNGEYTLDVSSTGPIVGAVQNAPLAQDVTGSFGVDAAPPSLSAVTNDITTAGVQPATFSVTYTDNTAVNTGTLASGNVLVTAPNGYSQLGTLVTIDDGTNGPQRTATYTVPAPPGGWVGADNNVYSINLLANQVSDVNANYAPAQLVSAFNVNIVVPAPTVTGSAPDITVFGNQAETFTLTYNSSVTNLNASTIASGNVGVIGQSGPVQLATLVPGSVVATNSTITATYSIPAPAVGWTAAANGPYAVNMRANQVSDANGTFVPVQFITSFNVNIPTDTTPPSVSGSAPDITTRGTQAETFSITYTDDTAVKGSTIGTGNLLVKGPANFNYSQVATLVSVDSTANGPTRTATYSVPAPTSGWSAYANGPYAISMQANQVCDVSGNFVPVQVVANFTVNVPDTQGPAVAGSAPNINAVSTQPEFFSITYTDATAVNFQTIAKGIAVIGPNGVSQTASFVSVDNSTDGPVRTAKYSVPAPAGGWSAAANGAYAILVRTNQISDTLGNFSYTQFVTAFNVNTPPSITGISPNPVAPSSSAQNITITGSNFASNATVDLRNAAANLSVNANIVSRTATQIVASYTFGTTPGNWTAEVLNGTASSGQVPFSVSAFGIGVNPNPVTGKTATLNALSPGTNASTLFKWAATTIPSGAIAPTFGANNTNAAKTSTITFYKAGSYTLKLTSTTGSTVKTATLTFTVAQTVSSVTLAPTSVTLTKGKTQLFTATAKDQFGAALATQPAFTWSLSGVGSLSVVGKNTIAELYTAPATATGSATVRATASGVSGTAGVKVS